MKQTYDTLISDGSLKSDMDQSRAIEALDRLHGEVVDAEYYLIEYDNGLCKWEPSPNRSKATGVYLYGTVGRGKSMLMGLLFKSIPIHKKRRVHFHSFMEELHHKMHTLPVTKGVDAMHLIASDIARDSLLLCFDEFYITNIADAMMLGRLFEKLFACGVVICATSNWSPENLFKEGHNRQRFMPFIRMINTNLVPIDLGTGQDYRRQENTKLSNFFVGDGGHVFLVEKFTKFGKTKPEKVHELNIQGHTIPIEKITDHAVWFKFNDLCAENLGREHYIEIADMFDTVIVEDIPKLGPNEADVAMRFIVLVDILYETQTRLICSAQAAPDALCTAGDSAFAFERTASRLMEMQGL